MNISDVDIQLTLTAKLKELIGSIRWLKNWSVDSPRNSDQQWDLVVRQPDKEPVLVVECKAHLTPNQFIQKLRRKLMTTGKLPVLGMPRISERMANLCRDNGWGWYDLAGNCHIEIPDRLFLERTGLPPVTLNRPLEANLGTPESSRVVRVLLSPANAGQRWTQRQVVEHFNHLDFPMPAPSLALVNKVVQFLRNQAVVESCSSGGFRVCDPEALLKLWCSSYRFDQVVQRRYFTLLKEAEMMKQLALHEDRLAYALGAFTAANLQAPHVRQSRFWFYADQADEPLVSSLLEAKQVDSGPNLIILFSGDPGVFYQRDRSNFGPLCTNPIQTYADLLHVGGRGEEAAEAILIQNLRPRWEESNRE